MTAADWAIVAVVILSVVLAAIQGLFREAFSMAGLVVGYLVAAWQYQRPAAWLMALLKPEWLADVLGFLVIFFAVLILFGLAGKVAHKLMKAAGLSGFDRFLGGMLGVLKGGLLVSVVLMCMTAFTPTSVPAPGRLSRMRGCFRRKDTIGATARAMVSLGDPAVYGRMTLIGRSG